MQLIEIIMLATAWQCSFTRAEDEFLDKLLKTPTLRPFHESLTGRDAAPLAK
jgi:hypothetical protein